MSKSGAIDFPKGLSHNTSSSIFGQSKAELAGTTGASGMPVDAITSPRGHGQLYMANKMLAYALKQQKTKTEKDFITELQAVGPGGRLNINIFSGIKNRAHVRLFTVTLTSSLPQRYIS